MCDVTLGSVRFPQTRVYILQRTGPRNIFISYQSEVPGGLWGPWKSLSSALLLASLPFTQKHNQISYLLSTNPPRVISSSASTQLFTDTRHITLPNPTQPNLAEQLTELCVAPVRLTDTSWVEWETVEWIWPVGDWRVNTWGLKCWINAGLGLKSGLVSLISTFSFISSHTVHLYSTYVSFTLEESFGTPS